MVSRQRQAACVFFFLTSTCALATNIIVNPSFEIAGPGGETDAASWDQSTDSGENRTNERSSLMPSVGDWSLHLSTEGNLGTGGILLASQRHAFTDLPSLMENQTIVTRFDVKFFKSRFDYTGQVEIAIIAGEIGVGGAVVDDTVGRFSASDTFVTFESEPLVVPDFDDYPGLEFFYQINFRVESSSGDGAMYAEAFIDNVVADAILVPEPSSAALIAFGGLIFLIRRLRLR